MQLGIILKCVEHFEKIQGAEILLLIDQFCQFQDFELKALVVLEGNFSHQTSGVGFHEVGDDGILLCDTQRDEFFWISVDHGFDFYENFFVLFGSALVALLFGVVGLEFGIDLIEGGEILTGDGYQWVEDSLFVVVSKNPDCLHLVDGVVHLDFFFDKSKNILFL